MYLRKNLETEFLLLMAVHRERATSEILAEFASDIHDKSLYACNMEKALLCKSLKCSKYRLFLTEQ